MTVGVISNELENAILNHTLRDIEYVSPGSNIYVALFTDAVEQDDDNSATEVDGGGYSRVQVTSWNSPISGSTKNSNIIDFGIASSYWGNVRYLGVFDNISSGSFLFWGQLSSDKDVKPNDPFVIDAEDLSLYLGGAISFSLSGSLINHILRDTPMSTSGSKVYISLYFDNPTQSDIGTEISGSAGYSRKNFQDWFLPISGSSGNSSEISFDAATSPWGNVAYAGIKNTESGEGDLLYFGELDEAGFVDEDDVYKFSASGLHISLD
jgi:hypothetical protein